MKKQIHQADRDSQSTNLQEGEGNCATILSGNMTHLLHLAHQRKLRLLIVLLGFSLLVIMIAPMFGLTFMTPWGEQSSIFWQMRFPRMLAAWCVGAGLSVSGLVFQAILRNPLAEPFTLGVAAGASLGAAIYIYLGLSFTLGLISGISFAAFLGATLITLLIYTMHFRRQADPMRLLLMGVILTFFISSILMLLQSLGKSSSALAMMSWMMGRFSMISLTELWQLLLVTIVGLGIISLFSGQLNLLQQGDVVAFTRGVDSSKTMGILFLVVSLMTGIFVALTGPIGFVGMLVPHVVRKLFGADHRWLIPASILLGGTILIVADTIGSLLLRPAEIPVGVVTAIFGAPFFLYILLKKQRQAHFVKPK